VDDEKKEIAKLCIFPEHSAKTDRAVGEVWRGNHRFVVIVRIKHSDHDAKHTGHSCLVQAGAVTYGTRSLEEKVFLQQLIDWKGDLMRTFPAPLRGVCQEASLG
jgi:hypothetical protein